MPVKVIVGVTGASGIVYARRLLGALVDVGADVDLIVSPLGRAVAASELGDSELIAPAVAEPARLTRHRHDDLFSALASG